MVRKLAVLSVAQRRSSSALSARDDGQYLLLAALPPRRTAKTNHRHLVPGPQISV